MRKSKIALCYNPYDFSNPVIDHNLFSGREEELSKVRYYLDQAKNAPRAINVSIIGPRASGKTSFLNIIEKEAKDRGFCVARIDLNESDAVSPLLFFQKVFDSAFREACSMKREDGSYFYEGKTGKTFQTYLDMISTYSVPEEKTWCPFIFPIQYAKAMSVQRSDAQFSEPSLKDDLTKLSKELGMPIALLFDECDILTLNRVLLQMLRNVFMNIPGYFLTLTGTPNLFPSIDEVFSPIARQFKRIELEGFSNPSETQDCIFTPLKSLEINPYDLFDRRRAYRDVIEIHEITGGKPYEIQLICHMLFLRIQKGKATQMRVNIEVLNDVNRELSSGKHIESRLSINRIRDLEKDFTDDLTKLLQCSGRASFEQMWFVMHVLEKNDNKKLIADHLAFFVEQGIIDTSNGLLTFQGDEFDRIYLKYLMRTKGQIVHIQEAPYDLYTLTVMGNTITDILEQVGITKHKTLGFGHNPDKILGNLRNLKNLDTDCFEDLKETFSLDFARTYSLVIEFCEREQNSFLELIGITLQSPWGNQNFIVCSRTNTNNIKDLFEELTAINRRAEDLNGQLLFNHETIEIPSHEYLSNFVVENASKPLKSFLASEHMEQAVTMHLKQNNIQSALTHADLSYLYSQDAASLNNVGYLYMQMGNLEEAESYFKSAIEKCEEESIKALLYYNTACTKAKRGNLDEALAIIKDALDLCSKQELDSRMCGCLLAIMVEDGKIAFKEKADVDIKKVCIESKEAIEEYFRLQNNV